MHSFLKTKVCTKSKYREVSAVHNLLQVMFPVRGANLHFLDHINSIVGTNSISSKCAEECMISQSIMAGTDLQDFMEIDGIAGVGKTKRKRDMEELPPENKKQLTKAEKKKRKQMEQQQKAGNVDEKSSSVDERSQVHTAGQANQGNKVLENPESQTGTYSQAPRKNYEYGVLSQGPYSVYITKMYTEKVKNYSDLDIARILDVIDVPYNQVCPVARNVWDVSFLERTDANNFANNEENRTLFAQNGLNVYVPKHRVVQRGIVRGVPFDIDADALLAEINEKNSGVHAIASSRMKRKVKNEDGTNKWQDTKSFWVDFGAKTMPEKLLMFKTRVEVTVYVDQTVVCYKCGKIGHRKKFCKKEEEKCLNCGEGKHTSDNEKCDRTPKCLNCNQQHHTLNSVCREFDKAKKIKKTMATDNVSFFEARKQVIKQSYAEAAAKGSGQQSSSQAKDQYQRLRSAPVTQFEVIEIQHIEKVASEIAQSCTSKDTLKKLIEILMRTLNQLYKRTPDGPQNGDI